MWLNIKHMNYPDLENTAFFLNNEDKYIIVLNKVKKNITSNVKNLNWKIKQINKVLYWLKLKIIEC